MAIINFDTLDILDTLDTLDTLEKDIKSIKKCKISRGSTMFDADPLDHGTGVFLPTYHAKKALQAKAANYGV